MQKGLAALVVILIAGVGLTFALRGEKYAPHTEVLTFERDVDQDQGRQLKAEGLVATNGTRMTDVYDPSTKKFTMERKSRYGADRNSQGGQGLTMKFVRKDGVSMEPFDLPGWKSFEETTRPKRRADVEEAEPRLAKAIEAFIAPVERKLAFAIVFDKTEGVNSDLAKRVRGIVNDTRATELKAAGNDVVLSLYNITRSPYQGGRQTPNLTSATSLEDAVAWLVSEEKEQKNSSVLLGLKVILQEMAGLGDRKPKVHVVTDGLENTDDASVYKKSELLNEENWAKLDEVAHLENLKLSGLNIILHPLPATSATHAKMMEKGLAYLADRLSKAGASVNIEPL